ncbi:MAG: hypothetical protein IPN33_07370 [Saprospiraceae bacterium]|nr:hypothetical protein [Saprospiraceae bacterium]
MRTIFYCICAAAVLLGQAGCANGAGKPRLIADYFVRYLADVSEIKAQASFYEGDTLETAVPKVIAGGVSFQQSAMEAKSLQREVVRYLLQRRSEFIPPFTFAFTGDDGEKVTYTLPMNPIDSFSFKGPISKSKGGTLILKGEPLSAKESLVVLFSDARNQAGSVTIQGPITTQEVFIPATNLANLQTGAGMVYLVRKIVKIEDTPARYVIAAGEYYTPAIGVVLVE